MTAFSCDKTGHFCNFASLQFQQILTSYDKFIYVNLCVITPMPFFHRSYNGKAIASSCLNIATALVVCACVWACRQMHFPTGVLLSCSFWLLNSVQFLSTLISLCLQCFDTGYLSGARCRLFAYDPADATAIPKPHNLLPHLNPDWFYLFGTALPRLSSKRGR